MKPTVMIDSFSGSLERYFHGYAVVIVDVIRSTTTAITAVALGRRCFPVSTVEAALPLAARLSRPILAGEWGGNMPYGFEITNSPVDVESQPDLLRPMILLSSSGTKLMCRSEMCDASFLACLRNERAVAEHVVSQFDHVAVIGAGTRNEFREEDQLCCAWVARRLVTAGFVPENKETAGIIDRWGNEPAEKFLGSKSVEYLHRTGQEKDLTFILSHINDLHEAYGMSNGEVVRMIPARPVLPLREFAA